MIHAVRLFLVFLAAFFSVSALSAQEADSAAAAKAETFPLTQILELIEYAGDGNSVWQPDWPAELPPDAFKIAGGDVSGITVEGDNFSLALGFDSQGRLEEFPFLLNGAMSQVSLAYNDDGLTEMTITPPSGEDENSGEPWNLEFLSPLLVRVSQGNTWYFIYLSEGGNQKTETWYDADGNALGVYGYSLIDLNKNKRTGKIQNFADSSGADDRTYLYDSWGSVAEISGTEGVFRVSRYGDNLIRYREMPPPKDSSAGGDDTGGTQNLYLQWDGQGFLVRITGETDNAGNGPTESRYEYSLDDNGNWIERRETQMLRQFGVLTPSPGAVITRTVEYREKE